MTDRIVGVRMPPRRSSAFNAGELLAERGPTAPVDLFRMIHLGRNAARSRDWLAEVLDTGWLVEVEGGAIDASKAARDHFIGEKPSVKFAGLLAEPRVIDVMHRPPISAKYRPNSKGMRNDIPAFSIREKP